MLTFDDLPVELALKVLSYLPQRCLQAIAEVSERWKTLAFDPSLWTEVRIDWVNGRSSQHVRDILDRATMIRKLDISAAPLYFDVIALASVRFKMIKEMVIPGRVLSHASMPVILRNCETLSKVVLCGEDVLLSFHIRTLEHLKCLKTLVASLEVKIDDDVLQQLCISCPQIERLQFNSHLISRRESWEGLQHLRHLKSLSISQISSAALLRASGSCGSLELLQIGAIWNENDVTVAHALERFRKLRTIVVYGKCGMGWLDHRFRLLQDLEIFDVARLHIQEQQLMLLTESCRNKLLSVAFSALMLTPSALSTLCSCINLRSISISHLSGKTLLLTMLLKFPNLVRAHLHVALDATKSIRKLRSIVDILDVSRKGGTRLELRIHSASQSNQEDMIREVWRFKDFLALNTRVSKDHVRDLEEQCERIRDAKIYWLPIGSQMSQVIVTSFPVMSKTLKHLILEVSD